MRSGTYEREDVGQGAKQDRESPAKLDVLDSLEWKLVSVETGLAGEGKANNLGNHIPVKLNITLAIPVKIKIELDALVLGLVHINLGEVDGHGAEVDLLEHKAIEGSG